jgi:hypothetical protein
MEMSDDIKVEGLEPIPEVKEEDSQELKIQRLSSQNLRIHDSFNVESSKFPGPLHGHDSKVCYHQLTTFSVTQC